MLSPLVNLGLCWLVAVFLAVVAGLREASAEACSGIQLVGRATKCENNMRGLTMLALRGKLNAENREQECRAFTKSKKCFAQVKKHCGRDFTLMDEMLSNAERGVGQLCTNQDAFRRYSKHSGCYVRHEVELRRCLNGFDAAVNETLPASNSDHNHNEFCRSLSDLTRCVDRRIEKSCGQQATSQFYALLKSKVPGQLAEICPINTTNVSPSPSAGSVPSKSLVATVAMTTACVALIRHVV